jgi:para-nitrobenzyl esterase
MANFARGDDGSPVVETRLGPLKGRNESGLAVFRGVPYAAAPIGDMRFKPPESMRRWSEPREAGAQGPVPPQLPSRLAAAMGDFSRPQDEDCLTLTIHAPAAPAVRPRAVIAWFHGGAYMSGAGSLDWYSGASLARRGDVIHVGVNYRLGLLGYLFCPGTSPGNLGLRDQMAALGWIRDNIAAFGGDPHRVTVAGQSAGASSILAIMAAKSGAGRGLFRRAILQSGPFGLPPMPLDVAERFGAKFAAEAGGADRLRTLPWPEILRIQGAVLRAQAPRVDGAPPFQPVADGVLLGSEMLAPAVKASSGIDIMAGITHDEMFAFYAANEAVKAMSAEQVTKALAASYGAEAASAEAEYRKLRPGAPPWQRLADYYTDRIFGAGTLDLAERLASAGRPAWLYRFDWSAPGNSFGACHCIELAFQFHEPANWNAGMLKGADAAEIANVASALQGAWVGFANSGDPNNPSLPEWRRHEARQRWTLRFASAPEAVGDLYGRAWRRYWPGLAAPRTARPARKPRATPTRRRQRR